MTEQPAAEVFDLWPEGVPAHRPGAPPERQEGGHVFSVAVPTLTRFPPASGTANGTAVIICPGGGYALLAMENEAAEARRWLNGLGVTVFVLKSRVAPQEHPAPLLDVVRAVRLVRARAASFGVDPHRIGLLGASAGGHLAASAGTLHEAPEAQTGAALDATDGRPDFLALLYPVVSMQEPYAHAGSRRMLLGEHPKPALMERLSIERRVTARTPPTFIVHSEEDRSVLVENALALYQALRRAGVAVEMHLYEKGAHGFGLRPGLGPTSAWPQRCEEWMRHHGWLPSPAAVPARSP